MKIIEITENDNVWETKVLTYSHDGVLDDVKTYSEKKKKLSNFGKARYIAERIADLSTGLKMMSIESWNNDTLLTCRQKLVYVAGPMTGLENYNFTDFYNAEVKLIKQGYAVVNPARLDNDNGFDETKDKVDNAFLRKAFARDIVQLARCDAIFMLKGWENSKGAKIERATAVDVFDMEVIK